MGDFWDLILLMWGGGGLQELQQMFKDIWLSEASSHKTMSYILASFWRFMKCAYFVGATVFPFVLFLFFVVTGQIVSTACGLLLYTLFTKSQ